MARKANAPADWPVVFLTAYSTNGNLWHSAKAAHVSRMTVYRLRRNDGTFAAAMAQAQDQAWQAIAREQQEMDAWKERLRRSAREIGRRYSDAD